MRKNKNKKRRELKKVYSIIVEGKCEKWYFQLMRDYESEKLPRIDIKPELSNGNKLVDQYKLVKENSKIYNHVIWILDLDVLINEAKESKKNRSSIISDFNKYKKDLERKKNGKKNVSVLVNTPCLEFWFLLHFKNTGKYFPKCKSVENEIKRYDLLKDYD